MKFNVICFFLMFIVNCISFSVNAEGESPGAFVYTELQISAPFDQVPWKEINRSIKEQDGFRNKTWLSGVGNQSAGGFYEFEDIVSAKRFVAEYFPGEARKFGVAQTTRVFEAGPTISASVGMGSVHFGGGAKNEPKAFVYTELQSDIETFSNDRWVKVNEKLKSVKGLICKTWLYGSGTGTPGGLYAFDSIENAKDFAVNQFPNTAKSLDSAFYTRIFDAEVTRSASIDMNSPYYKSN